MLLCLPNFKSLFPKYWFHFQKDRKLLRAIIWLRSAFTNPEAFDEAYEEVFDLDIAKAFEVPHVVDIEVIVADLSGEKP